MDSALFGPGTGNWLIQTCNTDAEVWEMPGVPLPAPSWLPDLAEAVAGLRVDDDGTFEPVSHAEVLRLQIAQSTNAAPNMYAKWGRWFFADRLTRSVSPSSRQQFGDYAGKRSELLAWGGLEEALRLSPTNAVLTARLAERRLKQADSDPRLLAEARTLARRARLLAPDNQEVRRVTGIVLGEPDTASSSNH